jgi:ATP adenylyltransferase
MQKLYCPFCDIKKSQMLVENDLAFAITDGYPVVLFHTLVIPRRHVESYFDLSHEEREACHGLLVEMREKIQSLDPNVTGFNIGVNSGESAGQTIFHCHIHLIPRRAGDVDDPRGGVRHTIPGKGFY